MFPWPFNHISRNMLQKLDPERAHAVTLWALERGLYPRQRRPDDIRLAQKIWGIQFRNPIGIAAGFDKNGRVSRQLNKMGFGFVEVGTVTPQAQAGNQPPRIFRLPDDHAVINRLGFNNQGHDAVQQRLKALPKSGVLGVNLGANKDSRNRTEDYVDGLGAFIEVADYFTVNISSPNTPGLRDLQMPEHLNALLSWLIAARGALMEAGQKWCPILIKLSPDIAEDELGSIIECLLANNIDGIIVSNTTLARTGIRNITLSREEGGLSGRPLFIRSTQLLAQIHLMTEGTIPLIGVGGIDSGDTALAKIQAGASLIQLYTGLIYKGPALIKAIKKRLLAHIKEKNYDGISEVVGEKVKDWAAIERTPVP